MKRRQMKKITNQELEEIVLHGIAVDIFTAERAYCMFTTIGKESNLIGSNNYQEFFRSAQAAFRDQFLLAMGRLFDKASDRNKTRCIAGIIELIENNSFRLPAIVERTNLCMVMRNSNFGEESLKMVLNEKKDEEIAIEIVNHFKQLLNSKENLRLSEKLKEIRDKRLAHNDLKITTDSELIDKIDIITFKDLYSLVEIAKHFIGVIGWAFMSMVFMHDGEYHLTESAKRPRHLLLQLFDKLKEEKSK